MQGKSTLFLSFFSSFLPLCACTVRIAHPECQVRIWSGALCSFFSDDVIQDAIKTWCLFVCVYARASSSVCARANYSPFKLSAALFLLSFKVIKVL